jgi:uncharacterized protein YdeI (YjbR/CyaY-like superfamily)
MEITETFHAPDRATWRAWLAAHHTTKTEIWLMIYKKHTATPSISYDEAVEEALCFGWIDGILKRVDNDRHVIRFTPRRKGSNWSELNKWRVGRVIAAGAMTPAGLEAIAFPLDEIPSERPKPVRGEVLLPEDLEAAFRADPAVWETFTGLSATHRRQFVGLITSAKLEETRERRIQEVIDLLRTHKTLDNRQEAIDLLRAHRSPDDR